MSSESTPILCGAIPTFEMFMSKWEETCRLYPRLDKYIQPGLEWAYKYYGLMDRTNAYIITMRKCLFFLPQIIKLIIICSIEPCHAHDVD
jgi:hypothetical protein